MRVADFYYPLPEQLIAQEPTPARTASRLLVMDATTGEFRDQMFPDLMGLLHSGDLLVLNDTRVIRARLRGHKESGGKVEILIERLLGDSSALAQVRASKSPKVGSRLIVCQKLELQVTGRQGDLFELAFPAGDSASAVLAEFGEVPLPPYIHRTPQPEDEARYQTVYAQEDGAVAAPTAGLHFDEDFLARVSTRGVRIATVTLHVGAGTFQPVRAESVEAHSMHPERVQVPATTCQAVTETRAAGKRVIAVGTTVVRALETASASGIPEAFNGESELFIYPGYEFRAVDALLTNFHLPGSTLLMLVSAFAGQSRVLQAYGHAVKARYRFFSYGDAMFITGRAR